jgi:aspartyl aminopeptidase
MTIDGLRAFLDASPSPWHAVESARGLLRDFTEMAETDSWNEVPDAGFCVRDGALIAWRLPVSGVPTRFRLAGAHTDSPCLRVKPRPDVHAHGWRQLGVEVYGGILNNSWLDRDLGVAGRLVGSDGSETLVNVSSPVARVPQLAVHLDREANNGLLLDRQQHLVPVWGVGSSDIPSFASWIAQQAGLDAPAHWWELCLYDVQRASVLGADRSLLASGRLDNQLSCWAALEAIATAPAAEHGLVIVLNDHEEVGSASTAGASGPLLEIVLERLVAARGGSRDELHRALAGSACVSADNAHAVHPNYADRHDPGHMPIINAGPALKINSNQRYATDAPTAQLFQAACDSLGLPWQVFVSRNNVPCGSTIGPLTATRLGIPTADVGVPQLSMHSARELCGVEDPLYLRDALAAFLAG